MSDKQMMAKIARPYAKAIFELSCDDDSLQLSWLESLDLLAMVAVDKQIVPVYQDPAVSSEQLLELFKDIAINVKMTLSSSILNLMSLLAENNRLHILPEIAVQYKQRLSSMNKEKTCVVTSVAMLNEQQKEKLQQALEKRFSCKVSLDYQLDKSLIGGAVIRAGDQVIDGSIRGKLASLHSGLSTSL